MRNSNENPRKVYQIRNSYPGSRYGCWPLSDGFLGSVMDAPQCTPTNRLGLDSGESEAANAELSHDKIEHRNTVSTEKVLGATDIERVEQMIKLAREQIKRLALVDEKDIAIINREVAQLGGQDTAGMLLRLARLDLTHVDDGEASPKKSFRTS